MARKNHAAPTVLKKTQRKRPGIHSKCRVSKLKSSKNYKKRYVGQGK